MIFINCSLIGQVMIFLELKKVKIFIKKLITIELVMKMKLLIIINALAEVNGDIKIMYINKIKQYFIN